MLTKLLKGATTRIPQPSQQESQSSERTPADVNIEKAQKHDDTSSVQAVLGLDNVVLLHSSPIPIIKSQSSSISMTGKVSLLHLDQNIEG